MRKPHKLINEEHELHQACIHKQYPKALKIFNELAQDRQFTQDRVNTMLFLAVEDAKFEDIPKLLEFSHQPTEATYSILIRAAAKQGKFEEALKYLAEAKATNQVAVRSYSALVQAYGAKDMPTEAFNLFMEAASNPSFNIDQNIYQPLLKALVGKKDHRNLLFPILDVMKRNLFILNESCEKELRDWFTSDDPSWKIENTTMHHSGKCPSCQTQLESIGLNHAEAQELKNELHQVIERTRDSKVFSKFRMWSKKYGPFDIVIDGLNVGFAGTGTFTPNLIVSMVEHFESQKKRVVVLAKTHVLHYDVLKRYLLTNRLFVIPGDKLDDLYWIYAALNSGMNVYCVTNDQMRDHKKFIAEDQLPNFLKWKLGHQLKYEFTKPGMKLQMFPHISYNPVVQNQGQENFHFPLEKDRWLCVSKLNQSKILK